MKRFGQFQAVMMVMMEWLGVRNRRRWESEVVSEGWMGKAKTGLLHT
jgi:hypothetical protein